MKNCIKTNRRYRLPSILKKLKLPIEPDTKWTKYGPKIIGYLIDEKDKTKVLEAIDTTISKGKNRREKRILKLEREKDAQIDELVAMAYSGGFKLDERLSVEEAIGYAVRNNSKTYRLYSMGEIEFDKFLKIVMRNNYRHEYTNYDELLRQGVGKDLARDWMTPNAEYLGMEQVSDGISITKTEGENRSVGQFFCTSALAQN